MPKAKEKEPKTLNISRFSAPFEVSYQYLFFLLRMYLYNTRNQFVGNTGTWVRIPPRPPNKNLKVDRNLEVFALYFGFKETLCLCGFRNTSCKSAAMRQCFLIVGSTFFILKLSENIRFNQKMKL